MQQNDRTVSGAVTDVFAHRFVVAKADGRVLADLGPKGAERVTLKVGDTVAVTGEMKPSELKVATIARDGGEPVAIRHDAKPGKHEGGAAPDAALRAVEAKGFTVVGEPRRRPKHFEIKGRDEAGDLVEFHVGIDGTLRTSKPLKAA